MGLTQDIFDAGGFAMDRKSSRPVPAGELPYALRPLGLWDCEIGEFAGLFKREPVSVLPVTNDLEFAEKRAKLINQNYIWPWRGTLADLVCLAALIKYDRLSKVTVFHTYDIPGEQYQWFRDNNARTHCCEPMDVLPYVTLPVLSTYCGDIIYEVQKDCTPIPTEWLNGNDWSHLEPNFGPLAGELAALGFKSIKAASWWLRIKYTWRFNLWRLYGELVLSCNGLQIHKWNQCPDFFGCPDLHAWVQCYANSQLEQEELIAQAIKYKNRAGLQVFEPAPYFGPYVRGTFIPITPLRDIK